MSVGDEVRAHPAPVPPDVAASVASPLVDSTRRPVHL